MGYAHDTGMCQFIPPSTMYGDTAVWTMGAGEVAGSIVYACDATDEVANLCIPVLLPSNSAALKGAYLKSVEIDYEIKTAACDSVTATIVKMTRGIEGAVVVVDAAVAFSQSPTAANSKTADQHRLVLTLTTPVWIDHNEYFYVKLAFDKAATSIVQMLGAFANFTLRV